MSIFREIIIALEFLVIGARAWGKGMTKIIQMNRFPRAVVFQRSGKFDVRLIARTCWLCAVAFELIQVVESNGLSDFTIS